MNSTRRLSLVCLAALWFLSLAGSAVAQVRTVLVSPVPGDPVASGTALRNALAGISSPSSTNRWLVKIEPGTYDIGTTSLPMRPWVNIEGSGIDATTIRGTVDGGPSNNMGTVNGASNTELRLLTISANATGTQTTIGLYNENAAAMRIYRVKFATVGASHVWGMRNFQSAPLIEECEFSVTSSSGEAYGLVYRQSVFLERSSILRSKIAVWGASKNYGVAMFGGQTLTVLRDSRIDVNGGQTTYGVFATGIQGWSGGAAEILFIRDTEISSATSGTGTVSYGVRFEFGAQVGLDVASSKIWAHIAPEAYAASQVGYAAAAMGFLGSSLMGATRTVESIGNVIITTTGLSGGPVSVSGWLGCVGVWDENGVFYANSCP
jgi:hypothetical protein